MMKAAKASVNVSAKSMKAPGYQHYPGSLAADNCILRDGGWRRINYVPISYAGNSWDYMI
jgi:hypothetical protein